MHVSEIKPFEFQIEIFINRSINLSFFVWCLQKWKPYIIIIELTLWLEIGDLGDS